MKAPLFDVGNPEFPFPGGTRTYRMDEAFAWRRTAYTDGTVEVHRCPIDVIDKASSSLWEPWNDPPPPLDEAHWLRVW